MQTDAAESRRSLRIAMGCNPVGLRPLDPMSQPGASVQYIEARKAEGGTFSEGDDFDDSSCRLRPTLSWCSDYHGAATSLPVTVWHASQNAMGVGVLTRVGVLTHAG